MINGIIRVFFLTIITVIYILVAVLGIVVDAVAELINTFLDGCEDLMEEIKNFFQ